MPLAQKRGPPARSRAASDAGSARTARGAASSAGGGRGRGRSAGSRGTSPMGRGKSCGRGKKKARAAADGDNMEARRSSSRAPADPVNAKVGWGDIMTCEVCQRKSQVDEAWGSIVKMRRSPAGGTGEQPVGPACHIHFQFHKEYIGWMPWQNFRDLYHESDEFKNNVDSACDRMVEVDPEVDFMREVVSEEDHHFIVYESPACYALKMTEVVNRLHCEAKACKQLKSILLPNQDGSDGVTEYYPFLKDPENLYPTIKMVSMHGAKRACQGLQPQQHIMEDLGRRLYENMNTVRAECSSSAHLFGNLDTFESAQAKLGIVVAPPAAKAGGGTSVPVPQFP